MSWEEEISELNTRGALSELMGGAEKVDKQHHFGKLTIRERIDAITDPDSFRKIGKLAGVGEYDDAGNLTGFTASNFVF
ncbi:MAG: methylmalonyl-CoA carboxyltransferase, partial [Gammaproteobacteria bacterium]|nr:methylmalonyl-CoA carboxyltransferase [Gammaproteobacteria bacterium]